MHQAEKWRNIPQAYKHWNVSVSPLTKSLQALVRSYYFNLHCFDGSRDETLFHVHCRLSILLIFCSWPLSIFMLISFLSIHERFIPINDIRPLSLLLEIFSLCHLPFIF